jgi:hypothetical protein
MIAARTTTKTPTRSSAHHARGLDDAVVRRLWSARLHRGSMRALIDLRADRRARAVDDLEPVGLRAMRRRCAAMKA